MQFLGRRLLSSRALAPLQGVSTVARITKNIEELKGKLRWASSTHAAQRSAATAWAKHAAGWMLRAVAGKSPSLPLATLHPLTHPSTHPPTFH